MRTSPNKKPHQPDPAVSDFDRLWDSSYEEVEDFIKARYRAEQRTNSSELRLIKEELRLKDFEIQKLAWQLGEREKELKALYEELNAQIELSEELNGQLEKYQKLLRIEP